MKRPHYFKNKTSFSKIELFKNINTGSSHFSLQKCSCYEQVWESKFAIQCGNIYLSLKRDRHREYFFNPVLKCDQLIEHLLDHFFFWKITLDVQLHLILTKWNEKKTTFFSTARKSKVWFWVFVTTVKHWISLLKDIRFELLYIIRV